MANSGIFNNFPKYGITFLNTKYFHENFPQITPHTVNGLKLFDLIRFIFHSVVVTSKPSQLHFDKFLKINSLFGTEKLSVK